MTREEWHRLFDAATDDAQQILAGSSNDLVARRLAQTVIALAEQWPTIAGAAK